MLFDDISNVSNWDNNNILYGRVSILVSDKFNDVAFGLFFISFISCSLFLLRSLLLYYILYYTPLKFIEFIYLKFY